MDYDAPNLRTVLNQLEHQTCVSTAYEISHAGYDVTESSDHVVHWCKAYWRDQHSRIHDVGSNMGLALAQYSGRT